MWAAGALHPLVPMAALRTVWRIRLHDGSVVHCVLRERRPKTAVEWYRDDEVQGAEEFVDPAEAEDWAARLRDEVAVECLEAVPPRTLSWGRALQLACSLR